MINSHLLYQLSYRGMRRILLIQKGKSSVSRVFFALGDELDGAPGFFQGFFRLWRLPVAQRGYHGSPEVVSRAAGLKPQRYAFMMRFDLSLVPRHFFAPQCGVLS